MLNLNECHNVLDYYVLYELSNASMYKGATDDISYGSLMKKKLSFEIQ